MRPSSGSCAASASWTTASMGAPAWFSTVRMSCAPAERGEPTGDHRPTVLERLGVAQALGGDALRDAEHVLHAMRELARHHVALLLEPGALDGGIGPIEHAAHEAQLALRPLARLVVVDEEHGPQPAAFHERHVEERPDADALERSRIGNPRIGPRILHDDGLAAPQDIAERAEVVVAIAPAQARHALDGPVGRDVDILARLVEIAMPGPRRVERPGQELGRHRGDARRIVYVAQSVAERQQSSLVGELAALLGDVDDDAGDAHAAVVAAFVDRTAALHPAWSAHGDGEPIRLVEHTPRLDRRPQAVANAGRDPPRVRRRRTRRLRLPRAPCRDRLQRGSRKGRRRRPCPTPRRSPTPRSRPSCARPVRHGSRGPAPGGRSRAASTGHERS